MDKSHLFHRVRDLHLSRVREAQGDERVGATPTHYSPVTAFSLVPLGTSPTALADECLETYSRSGSTRQEFSAPCERQPSSVLSPVPLRTSSSVRSSRA